MSASHHTEEGTAGEGAVGAKTQLVQHDRPAAGTVPAATTTQ